MYDLIVIDTEIQDINKNIDCFQKENNQWVIKNKKNKAEHGTVVLSIFDLQKHNIGVFNVFYGFGSDNLDNLLSALQYIYDNLECRYIQMSIGVMAFNQDLLNICKLLYKKGVIIVSAFANNMAISYPAAFDFVIGVDSDKYIVKNDDFYFGNEIVDVFAKYKVKQETSTYYGSSFATSYITKILLESDRQFSDKAAALKYLKEYKTLRKNNAIIFPYNKENKNVINNLSLSKFNIVDIYDVKHSVWFNKEVSDLTKKYSFKVKNIEKCDWTSFDTVIIGHLDKLEQLYRKDIKKQLLEKCLTNKKNVICYDDYLVNDFQNKFVQEGLYLSCSDQVKYEYTFDKLYQIKTPILAVIGTGSKQGKFTLQLQIREMLKKNGVNVKHLGTEPNSMILGCDEMFSCGYLSKNSGLSNSTFITILNQKLHELDVLNADLIITGAQSAIIPKYYYNTTHFNISSITYLYATRPDAVILTVDMDQPLEYIKKNILFIEECIGAKILFFAMLPFKINDVSLMWQESCQIENSEIQTFINTLKSNFNKETIVIGEKISEELILKQIFAYFCN